MKKRLLLFAILFFGLCGCDKDNGEDVDPPGIGHFVWVNASDHRITMTVNGQFEDEIMLPGERISKTMIGFIALPPSPDLYVMHGIEIVFDDGPYGGVFTRPKEYPAAPYNPCNEKEYVWEDMPVENDLSHWVWTYTFTNADYDAVFTVLGALFVTLNLGTLSKGALFACYIFEAIMFPTIFAISLRGLGDYTKRASSFLMMSPIGGAVGPLLMGYVADISTMSFSFVVPLFGYAVVLIYSYMVMAKKLR